VDPRRGLGSAAVDLADALSTNCIDRRDFLRRGAMLGLSATVLAALLQACSSDESAEPGVDGGARTDDVGNPTPSSAVDHIVVGIRQGDANSGLDPVNMTEFGASWCQGGNFEGVSGAVMKTLLPRGAKGRSVGCRVREVTDSKSRLFRM
jgi:hypothetical protein